MPIAGLELLAFGKCSPLISNASSLEPYCYRFAMGKMASVSLVLILTVFATPVSAQASGKSVQVKLDFTKPASQALHCDGITVPITYKLVAPIAKDSLFNVAIYNNGAFEQTLKMKTDASGVIKRLNGQEWYGNSGGNPMPHEWYVYPINSDPQELCSQMKSDVTFAKSRYTAYKSIVAIFVLRSKI